MSKFKVGDKAFANIDMARKGSRGLYCVPADRYGIEITIIEVASTKGDTVQGYRAKETGYYYPEYALEPIGPTREFIVLRRDGQNVIASHKRGDEIVKTAKATCNEKDTFDFATGAKLAFDRLMGREEPKPAHRFKVGDRVTIRGKYTGEISAISKYYNDEEPYLVYCPEIGSHSGESLGATCKPEHRNKCTWQPESTLSPAPEPPKFYTGKVVMIGCDYPDRNHLINHLFEFKDGKYIGHEMRGIMFNHDPYASFDYIKSVHTASKWIEVKE